MGDSGALGLGGILAMVAILSRNEIPLLMIGAAFVLEGLSALMSAKVLTPFFRKRLQLLRFVNQDEFVPHTEFPLPFLATPLHHHYDLLNIDRRRLVYGAHRARARSPPRRCVARATDRVLKGHIANCQGASR